MQCQWDGCDRTAVSRGFCRRCYKRYKYGHTPRPPRRESCAVEGCDNAGKYVQGYCSKHYSRYKRHGDPLHVEGTEQGTVRVESVVFNGITFRRYPDSASPAHRRYYKPGGQWVKQGVQALHQEVWKQYNGPIPEGHHIHHRDGDYSNNDISNLECVDPAQHWAEHSEQRSENASRPERLAHLASIRPLAAAWHSSPEGLAWHRQHAANIGFGKKRDKG